MVRMNHDDRALVSLVLALDRATTRRRTHLQRMADRPAVVVGIMRTMLQPEEPLLRVLSEASRDVQDLLDQVLRNLRQAEGELLETLVQPPDLRRRDLKTNLQLLALRVEIQAVGGQEVVKHRASRLRRVICAPLVVQDIVDEARARLHCASPLRRVICAPLVVQDIVDEARALRLQCAWPLRRVICAPLVVQAIFDEARALRLGFVAKIQFVSHYYHEFSPLLLTPDTIAAIRKAGVD